MCFYINIKHKSQNKGNVYLVIICRVAKRHDNLFRWIIHRSTDSDIQRTVLTTTFWMYWTFWSPFTQNEIWSILNGTQMWTRRPWWVKCDLACDRNLHATEMFLVKIWFYFDHQIFIKMIAPSNLLWCQWGVDIRFYSWNIPMMYLFIYKKKYCHSVRVHFLQSVAEVFYLFLFFY